MFVFVLTAHILWLMLFLVSWRLRGETLSAGRIRQPSSKLWSPYLTFKAVLLLGGGAQCEMRISKSSAWRHLWDHSHVWLWQKRSETTVTKVQRAPLDDENVEPHSRIIRIIRNNDPDCDLRVSTNEQMLKVLVTSVCRLRMSRANTLIINQQGGLSQVLWWFVPYLCFAGSENSSKRSRFYFCWHKADQ